MRHINDQTLDQLLEDSLDEHQERELETHVLQCHTCAARLREWEVLFPQIRGVAPATDGAAEAIEMPPTRSSVVIMPDWTPPPDAPRRARSRPSPLWIVVAALAVAAGWLAFRNRGSEMEQSSLASNEQQALAGQQALPDGDGLGSGLRDSIKPTAFAESAAAHAVQQPALDTLPKTDPEPPAQEPEITPAVTIADTENRPAVTPREPPVQFPIRAGSDAPVAGSPAPSNPPPTEPPAGPLPAEFTRVTLGDAITRLGGPVRLIDGMNPEAVEIAGGSALPGADPNRLVVRLIYNGANGRIILDQQRLNRTGPQEPDIAINTAASGVSVAQWVDWKGYWISLASRTNQEALLAIANRIRESP